MKTDALKLRTRIGFHFLGLVGTWTIFVMVLLGHRLTQKSQELFQIQGAELARGLAMECAPFARREELEALEALLRERMRESADVRYIIARRADGHVIASTFDDGVPVDLLTLEHPVEALPSVRVQLIDAERERLFDYRADAGDVQVQVGVSLTSVQLFAQEITTYMLWIGMAAFLAVLGVTLHVSRPVEALARAIASQTGIRGHAFEGTLETSALAVWFQKMSKDLDESAKKLDQSKKLMYLGEISASIAHEVNNPLGIIVLNSGFLARRVASGELAGQVAVEVERIRAASTRATLAAQQLLQVARYSTRKTEMRRRAFKPSPVIAETIDLLRDKIRLSGCVVKTQVPEDLPTVTLDQVGVQQVLFNLITNALDATPSGKEILIAAAVEERVFVLRVIDQGKGMSEELLVHATEPFITTKEAGKGTGLGLAISESIVLWHGGKLELSSKVGEGTTATVSLPLD